MTGQLLGDHYQLTPDISKLRTPQLGPTEDNILTESQNLIALQNAETPLKGGLNTPLHASQAGVGTTPVHKTMQTPNTMFQTPFRTPHGEVHATPSRTPLAKSNAVVAVGDAAASLGSTGAVPTSQQAVGPTSVRDKLSINPEEALVSLEDKAKQVARRDTFRIFGSIFRIRWLNSVYILFCFKKEYISQLKKNLSRLPAPKNDYEIVIPDENEATTKTTEEEDTSEHMIIPDQADLDAKNLELLKKKCK